MKILFISRAFPPVVGGLEKHNHALYEILRQKTQLNPVINRKGKKALPWFIPLATLKTLFYTVEYDAILLGDGVLAILGWIIKLLRPKIPIICIIHGLDITYSNYFYQFFWVKLFIPKMDKIVAVSHATANTAIFKGLEQSKLAVIPNGVHQPKQLQIKNLDKLSDIIGINPENKTILFTLGRLVKRKGVNWFIQQVMPRIKDRCIYIVAGDGPEKTAIGNSIRENKLEHSVFCCGAVSEELKILLYANSDLFIQPNIKVEGDMEGFGIAVLEANSYNLAVLGSNLEGLKDSITENQNGWLIEPENASAYVEKIRELLDNPNKIKEAGVNAKNFCTNHFSWDRIADQYIATISFLIDQKLDNING